MPLIADHAADRAAAVLAVVPDLDDRDLEMRPGGRERAKPVAKAKDDCLLSAGGNVVEYAEETGNISILG